MEAFVINKQAVNTINKVNSSKHKINIIELVDGRFVTPTKILQSPAYEYATDYLGTCEIITVTDQQIKKPQIGQ